MKKHKKLLMILFVFLCCLTLYLVYRIGTNIYSIWFYVKSGMFRDYFDIMLQVILGLLINLCGTAFSILGVVTLAKIFQDKQLFATPDQQPAPQNNAETSINKE